MEEAEPQPPPPWPSPHPSSSSSPSTSFPSTPNGGRLHLLPAPRATAAARCEAAFFPSWQLRAPPRRRNTLREKASPPLEDHQVRPPNHEASDSHRHFNKDIPLVGGTREPQSASLDEQPSPDLDDKLENSDCLADAGRNGDVESNLDGEKDSGWDAEEVHFCGAGTGPVFSVYEDQDGNAVHVEVNEDEIVSRCATTADGERSGDLQPTLSRARVMDKDFESGDREVPRNSSLVRFVPIEKKKSCVVDAELSVGQQNGAPLRTVAWSGFAAVCGICFVFIASKLVWRNVKAHLSAEVFRIPIPWMKDGQFNKASIKVISNVHMFPGDLLGRPQLERRELMNNLRKAKESRERFSLYASITGISRMVTDVNTLEEGSLSQRTAGKNSSVVFPHPVVAIEEEVSAGYVRQSVYHDDVSGLDISELSDISLSNDIINGSVEQSVDLKDVAPIIDIIVTNQYNVGEIEQPEPRYNDESTTDAKDRTSGLYATEKEARVYSADDHNAGPNGMYTLSAEFERKEQLTETAVSIQGLKPSVPFSSDKQMIYKNNNAHQISNNVFPETADDFSPNCLNISSGSKCNGAYLSNSENEINWMQEIEAPTSFANEAQTANSEDFAHCVSITSEEACKNLVTSDVSTMESPPRIREDPEDLMTANMRSMREPEPSNQEGKQIIYANEKDHKIDIVHNETKTSSETYLIGTLNKASTPPLYVIQEETVQHKGVKVSIAEKQEKIPSSNKEARAYLKKDEGKLQEEMWTDKVPATKLSAEGVPGTSVLVGPSNGVQKTKRVAQKRMKKVQSNQGVAEQDIVQNGSMVAQENSSQNVKRRRRKNQTNAFHTQGSQKSEEIPERSPVPSLSDDAPKAENMKPLGEAGSSSGILSSKDIYRESQPSRVIARTMRKEELKLDFQTSERVEAAAPETKTNMRDYNIMHERSTDVNKSKTKMGVAAAKKSTKRKSLTKRTKSSNPVSNKDSEKHSGD